MKMGKLLLGMLIGCTILMGCGKEEQNTQVGEIFNEAKLSDALANAGIKSGSISSTEDDITIYFYVENDQLEITGQYGRESFDCFLTDDKKEEFLNEIVDYSPTVQEKEYDYWPHTDEYPALLVLFKYNINFDNDYQYETDGALCCPDGWNEFVNRLVEIIEL